MPRKEAHPDVAQYYLGLTDDERNELDKRIKAAGRTLADMRFSKSTGKLDERLLLPKNYWKDLGAGRLTGKQRNPDGTIVWSDDDKPDTISRQGLTKTAGLSMRRLAGKRLKDGQSLSDWIRTNTADGVELAMFYLDILRMGPKDAKTAGVFMNHKLAAANYLVERGWGKPKGDDDEKKAITINVQNYAETNPPPKPVVETTTIEARIADAESDPGKDQPVIEDLSTVDSPIVNQRTEPIVEDFDLSEDR